jgi:Circularly permutated YpsA SLOG family
MSRGFLTEAGCRPDLAARYGAREMPTADDPPHTRQNARDSQATLRFGDTGSSCARTTPDACRSWGRPYLIVEAAELIRPSQVADWIASGGIEILNIAGNREVR